MSFGYGFKHTQILKIEKIVAFANKALKIVSSCQPTATIYEVNKGSILVIANIVSMNSLMCVKHISCFCKLTAGSGLLIRNHDKYVRIISAWDSKIYIGIYDPAPTSAIRNSLGSRLQLSVLLMSKTNKLARLYNQIIHDN